MLKLIVVENNLSEIFNMYMRSKKKVTIIISLLVTKLDRQSTPIYVKKKILHLHTSMKDMTYKM